MIKKLSYITTALISILFINGCTTSVETIQNQNQNQKVEPELVNESYYKKEIIKQNDETILWDGSYAHIDKDKYKKILKQYINKEYPTKVKKWKKQEGKRLAKIKERKRLVRIKEQKRLAKRLAKIKKEKRNTITIDGIMWQDNKDTKTVARDWESAKRYCRSLSFLGYNDWYLPTKEQLLTLYDNKYYLKNVVSGLYWSSSPSSSSNAWYVYFENGYSSYYPKTGKNPVRCARRTGR